MRLKQRAPSRHFFEYNKLRFSNLTTNRAVGSSNLSGRATNEKRGPNGTPFLFGVSRDQKRAPVRQNALAFWTPQAGRRPENCPKAIRVNLPGRATNEKRGPNGTPFLFGVSRDQMRAPVRQNALAFWTPQAGGRPENCPKAIRVNLFGRAKH